MSGCIGRGISVRWLPDGSLEYLGRLDRQVKIRGHRIEPDEIEGKLLALPDVSEAVIEARRDDRGHSYLIAYVVPMMNGDGVQSNVLDEAELEDRLRRKLRSLLPEYMVPTMFVFLDRMPLTPNGKINRKSLPKPLARHSERYIAPSDDTERKLAAIWEEVLGIERAGVTDSFFERGGHSLKAMNMLAKIEQVLLVRLSLRQVYEFPTIRELSALIRRQIQDQEIGENDPLMPLSTVPSRMLPSSTLPKAPQQDTYPASSAQRSIYLTQRLDASSTGYNMPFAFELEGSLDIRRLEEAFHALIERHESLRTTLEVTEGELRQCTHPLSKLIGSWKWKKTIRFNNL